MVFFCVSKPCRDFQGRDGMSREGVERAQIPISHWLQPHHQPITACCAKGTYAIHLGYHCALPLWAPSPEASTLLVLLLFSSTSTPAATPHPRSIVRFFVSRYALFAGRLACPLVRFLSKGLSRKGPFFHHPARRITKRNTPTTHHVNQQHVGLVLSFIKLQGTSSPPRKALPELKGTYAFRLHVDDNCRYPVLGCLLAVTVTLAPGKTSSVSSSQKDPHQTR